MGVALSMTLESYKTVAESVKNEIQKVVGPIFTFLGVAWKKTSGGFYRSSHP